MNKREIPKKHGEFLKLVLLNAQKRWPNSRWFQRDVGLFKTLGRGAPIKIGMKGQSDIYGMVMYGEHHTLWVELEVKLPHDKMSKHQKNWKETVENFRGLFIEVRSFEDLDKIDEEINRRLQLLNT